MELFSVILKMKEEKKHSVRYDAVPGPDVGITAVYIAKSKLPVPYPAELTVVVATATA